MPKNIRNIAIIAHVDHGKTTLVDTLLRQSKTKLRYEIAGQSQILDSNELERERGITIFSKNASIEWKGVKINIIDTPGHADFGGEVERVLKMADAVLLLVDAKEGPMPQTRFVLKKALELGLDSIVVINKIDKSGARPDFALDKTFDLFVELGANNKQLDFPVIYASGILGKAGFNENLEKMQDVSPILDTILEKVAPPKDDETKPLQMLVVSIFHDNYKGRVGIGRIFAGKMKIGQVVAQISRNGKITNGKITALIGFKGLEKIYISEAGAGDIVGVAGIFEINIGETVADAAAPKALASLNIEEPTVKVTFSVNTSPFAGKEGKFSTSRNLRERLYKELETDVALRVCDGSSADAFIVSGRGELHLGILIERMRREGYEVQVSRPEVILKNENGKVLTPYEKIFIEVPEEFQGAVIKKMNIRKAELLDMRTREKTVYLDFLIPTKYFFGFRSEFLTDTKGLGIMNTLFDGYHEDDGKEVKRNHGSIISYESGVSNTYAISYAQERGRMFIGPNVSVYAGMIIGQAAKDEDIEVNICKEKKLSNMRSKGEGVAKHIDAPKVLSLEEALEYIGEDELVEVTPKNIRIRKKILDANERRKAARK